MNFRTFIQTMKVLNKELSLKFEQFYYICLYNREHKLYSQFKLNKQQIAEIDAVYKRFKKIKHFRLVSWDIAFDKKDQPLLLEANLHYGELDFHQLNNGPIFGDDTIKILEEVFSK